jgi:sulfate transport system permease protein
MSRALSVPGAPSTSASRARGRRRLVRGLIIGATVGYVAFLLLLPLIGIVFTALEPGLGIVTETLAKPEVRHAFYLTAQITVITVVVTSVFGLIVAWVLVRQRFVGRSFMNALVDLPFALSPVTVGLAAVLLFGLNGWFNEWFTARGIQVIFALPSMVLVTIFICVPFTIRELVPVLEEIGLDEEDASRTLGASLWQTFFRVTFPNIRWALGYGIALTTARAIGEIGAVLIVSGLIKGKTETATIYIFTAIEERQTAEAYVVALILALVSVALLVAIEGLRRRTEHGRTIKGEDA